MAADSSNQQYSSPLFGIGGNYASTGAPGSEGITDSPPGTGGGPVIGRPVVSVPGASSQLPESRPTLSVTAGDSAGMADDLGAHTSAIAPGPLDGYLSDGPWQGHTMARHPNAGS